MASKLKREFFNRPTLEVARDLLGKVIVFNDHKGTITETEAYIGEDDPACHAAKGRTKRTEIMYGKAGHAYIYLIYGMYYCLNFVTEKEGFPAAVLIRGAIEYSNNDATINLNGPGKLCRQFGISTKYNGIDITKSNDLYLLDSKENFNYITSSRVGISKGIDKQWRFIVTT